MVTAEQKPPGKAKVAPIGGPEQCDNSLFFERIFRDHHRQLVQLLRRLPIAQDDAEDFAQDTLVRIIRQNEPEKLREAPRAYLYQVAVNLVRDNMRQAHAKKREHQVDSYSDIDQCAIPGGNPEQQVQAEQTLSQLKEALGELPTEQQRIFVLSRYHHLPTSEISKKLGVPLRSVQRRLCQAIAYCQEKVGYHHER